MPGMQGRVVAGAAIRAAPRVPEGRPAAATASATAAAGAPAPLMMSRLNPPGEQRIPDHRRTRSQNAAVTATAAAGTAPEAATARDHHHENPVQQQQQRQNALLQQANKDAMNRRRDGNREMADRRIRMERQRGLMQMMGRDAAAEPPPVLPAQGPPGGHRLGGGRVHQRHERVQPRHHEQRDPQRRRHDELRRPPLTDLANSRAPGAIPPTTAGNAAATPAAAADAPADAAAPVLAEVPHPAHQQDVHQVEVMPNAGVGNDWWRDFDLEDYLN